MQEIVLQDLWKRQALPFLTLYTRSGDPVQVLSPGALNLGSGPDFLFSRISIGDHLWTGHVEVHIRASDWYRHNHHLDKTYNSVVLHVVWNADAEVKREDGTRIPTLELSTFISEEELVSPLNAPGPKKLSCESLLASLPTDLRFSWKAELYSLRLRQKSQEVHLWAEACAYDWEHVFFLALLKGFGLNRNGHVFLSLGAALPYRLVRKVRYDLKAMESLFFGLSGLLERAEEPDLYTDGLIREYQYLEAKFRLNGIACQSPEFFSLRPDNFPTIRLSQLAVLYHENPALFQRVRTATTLAEVRALLKTRTSAYWETHYMFGKTCPKRNRETTDWFTDLLVLNAVIPVLLACNLGTGHSHEERVRKWTRELKAERNSITRLFAREGIEAQNARESQALIQLHSTFCSKNKCLQCRWGNYLLYGKY